MKKVVHRKQSQPANRKRMNSDLEQPSLKRRRMEEQEAPFPENERATMPAVNYLSPETLSSQAGKVGPGALMLRRSAKEVAADEIEYTMLDQEDRYKAADREKRCKSWTPPEPTAALVDVLESRRRLLWCLTSAGPVFSSRADRWVPYLLPNLLSNTCSVAKNIRMRVGQESGTQIFLVLQTVGRRCPEPDVLYVTLECPGEERPARLLVTQELPFWRSREEGEPIAEYQGSQAGALEWLIRYVLDSGDCAHFLRVAFISDESPARISEAVQDALEDAKLAEKQQQELKEMRAQGRFRVPITTARRSELAKEEAERYKAETAELLLPDRDWSSFVLATNADDPTGEPLLALVGSMGQVESKRRSGQLLAHVLSWLEAEPDRKLGDLARGDATFIYASAPVPLNRAAVKLLAGARYARADFQLILDEQVTRRSTDQQLAAFAQRLSDATRPKAVTDEQLQQELGRICAAMTAYPTARETKESMYESPEAPEERVGSKRTRRT